MKREILKLHEAARKSELRPWELQSVLKGISSSVIAVGDDLSFTIRLGKKIEADKEKLAALNGRKVRIYPFKNAYRFSRGYIAFEGSFLRVSRELDRELLEKILDALNIE